MTRRFEKLASRTLQVLDEDGATERLAHVHIGRPRRQRAGEWSVDYQITGLGDEQVHRVSGVDAIQALQLVQLAIGGILAGSEEAKANRLRWSGEVDLGFPIPPDRRGRRRPKGH